MCDLTESWPIFAEHCKDIVLSERELNWLYDQYQRHQLKDDVLFGAFVLNWRNYIKDELRKY